MGLLALSSVSFSQEKPQYDAQKSKACEPEQVAADWWLNRHKALTENLAKNKCELLFVGDSITHQWETPGKQVWDIMLAPYNPANFGIGGDHTQHVLWRMEDSKLTTPEDPKLCVIHIGTNNTGHFQGQQDPKNTAEGIKMIADKLIERFPKTHVVVLSIFPRGATVEDPLRKHNDLINAELNKIKSKNISVVDIGKRYLKEDGTFLDDTAPDLLHFTPKGYMIWAEAIMPYIHRYIGNRVPVIQPSNPDAPKLKEAQSDVKPTKGKKSSSKK